MEAAERLAQVQEYYFSQKLKEVRKLQEAGKAVLNLGIGSPDLMPAKEIIEELKIYAEGPDAHGYMPYQGLPVLRDAIAKHYQEIFHVNIEADGEILPLMGSKEGIMHISMAYLNPGDKVLVPELSYPTYSSVSRLMQAGIIRYPLLENHGWEPDWSFFDELDWDGIKIIWVNYPHMPTGVPGNQEMLEKFVRLGQTHDVLIVNDNPYSFLGDNIPQSILGISKKGVLELNSLSKTFNMAGWRVGWVAGDAEILKNIVKVKSNMDSGMFKPVQMAAVRALQLKAEWYDHVRTIYQERRAAALKLAAKLEMECRPGQTGMFLWGKIKGSAAERVDDLLHKHQIFVAPGHIFGEKGSNYIRISLCSPKEQIEEAIKRLV